MRFLAPFRAKREKILGYPEGSQIGTPENFGGSPPEWGGAPGIVFSENFRWLLPRMGGGATFSEFVGLLPRMGGSLRDSFWALGGSPGGVFKVAPPHLREVDRNPYSTPSIESRFRV